jgi:23S rRNA G2445 N2-methylase RlmL
MEKFFATCPRGLERVLAAELSQLGADSIQRARHLLRR